MKPKFFINIVLPALLSILAFIFTFLFFIIPYFEETMLQKKRETIKELTVSAWSVLDKIYNQYQDSIFSEEEAKHEAILIIQDLRYGEQMKDYFFITDMHPNMIMHPYREDLNNLDLTNYADPNGKKLFVECVKTVENSEEGFVDYSWQWKDDSTKIVSKLSYVKGFKPWNWIVGTGIYIEDVKMEINKLKSRLLIITIIISVLIGFGILYLIRQSLKIENKRIIADNKLKEAYEKYKKLVEASTESIFIYSDNKISYINKEFQDFTGYNFSEIQNIKIVDFLPELAEIKGKINQNEPFNFETYIQTKFGQIKNIFISVSLYKNNDISGYIFAIKDISKQAKVKKELDESREKLLAIINNVDIGIFRLNLEKKGKIIEANNSILTILGYDENINFKTINIFEHIVDKKAVINIIKQLKKSGKVTKAKISLRKPDNSIFVAMISLFIRKSVDNEEVCDGILQDFSKQQTTAQYQQDLIEELQIVNKFFMLPIEKISVEAPHVQMNNSISEAVFVMSKNKSDVLLIKNSENIIGILTNEDIRNRIVIKNAEINSPVYKIMSSPIISIPEKAIVLDAISMMEEKKIRNLVLETSNQLLPKIISQDQLLELQKIMPNSLENEIRKANNNFELKDCFNKIPATVKTLINSGINIKTVTHILSSFSDLITKKIIEKAIKKIGNPPVDFAFIALGSEARNEQTIVTDQDNAIIFDKTHNSDDRKYFEKLGTIISDDLNFVGYNYCKGEIMAKNSKWVQDIETWKNYFKEWITKPNPAELLDISIFFDFRIVYGEQKFITELQNFINKTSKYGHQLFFNMAQLVMNFRSPQNIFGSITPETDDKSYHFIDIKKVVSPLTALIKLYSIKNQITEKNTLKRIEKLFEFGIFSQEQQSDLKQIIDFLTKIRISNQLYKIENNQIPDNKADITRFSDLDISILKKIFSKISEFQLKMKFDFKLQ